MELHVEEAVIGGGASLSNIVDLRSRRLKAVQFPDTWATAKVQPVASATRSGTYGEVVTAAGAAVEWDGDDSEFVLSPADIVEGLAFVKFRSGTEMSPVAQGTAAGFTVTPDSTADFSGMGDTVTFTFTYEDGTTDEVTLDADYMDVDGLVTELNSQCAGVEWTNDMGAITAARPGPASSVTLTEIDDDGDLMGFDTAMVAAGDTSESVDVTLLLLTESRT